MSTDRLTRREVFGDGFALAAAAYRLDEPVPPHVHDFIEVAVVSGGRARHDTASGAVTLGPGDWVVVRPGDWHAYAPKPSAGPFEVTNIYLGPELVHGQLAWALDYPELARVLLRGGSGRRLESRALARVCGWLDQLTEEYGQTDRVIKAGLLSCVLVELDRSGQRPLDPTPPAIAAGIRTVIATVAEDLTHPWTVAELASLAGLSTSTLYRQFSAQLGVGPVEWLTRARAERASALLIQTDLPVAAIGRRVGWPDPSYASRRFGQVYATTPTAYRTAHRRP